MLEADLQLKLSRLDLDVAFTVEPGEVLAVLGPNGAGKSTILNVLTGLREPAAARVVLDDVVLEDTATGTHVAPEKRRIGLMFQNYLLFPHMSALENVAFGLRATGVRKHVARRRAAETLSRLGVDDVSSARPAALSGGQQQRVAMARTLVTDPQLLLLDEPLAALDVSIKTEIRRLLHAVLRESRCANILVTHDLLDAVALGDRMIVVEGGRIAQTGTPAEVTARPRSRYVADLTGVNLLRGTSDGSSVEFDGGGRLACADGATGTVLTVIAPADVSVSRHRPDGTGFGENVWQGEITAVDLMGDRVRVRIDGPPEMTAEVMPATVDELRLGDGGKLWATVPPTGLTVYTP